MPPFAVSITKSVSFRGAAEEFSNVYHYDIDAPFTTEQGWRDLVDAIVALEKPVHSTLVTYKSARVWGPTNQGPNASTTRLIADLTGTGSNNGGGVIWPELCVVGQFFVGRASGTQRKRFLRKYYHITALPASPAGSNVQDGRGALAAGDKSPTTTALNGLKNISVGGQNRPLCTPQGDHLPVGSSPQVLPWLHVRQFKQ